MPYLFYISNLLLFKDIDKLFFKVLVVFIISPIKVCKILLYNCGILYIVLSIINY